MPVTYLLIGISVLASIAAFNNPSLMARWQFNAYLVFHGKQYHRLITHAFIHGNWVHLGVNMWVLAMFGKNAENWFHFHMGQLGTLYFVLLYVGGIFFATLPSLRRHKDNMAYNSLGASGAVAAVLFSSIVFEPLDTYILLIFPVPVYAIIFGILYLIYEAYMDRRGGDYIAHDAHYWGAVFGAVFTFAASPDIIFDFFNQLSYIFS